MGMIVCFFAHITRHFKQT